MPENTPTTPQLVAAPDLVPLREGAEESKYSPASMYRFASEGRIQLVRRGNKTYIERDELERFKRDSVKPFVPGERIIANAGGHRQPRAQTTPKTKTG
jgi:hypothetical protein